MLRLRINLLSTLVLGFVTASGPAHADAKACHSLATDPREKTPPVAAGKGFDALTAIAACKKAVQAAPKNGRLQYQLARAYFGADLPADGLEHLKLAAANDYALAQLELFKLVDGGKAGKKLPNAKMASLLIHAAAANVPEARYLLAINYFKGRYVQKNVGKAASMMKALADKGYREAVRDYALLIERGAVKGAARGDADKLLKAAAEKGDAQSMVELGYKAQRARRAKEALQWYEKAAARGYAGGAYAAAMVLPVVKPKNWRTRTYNHLKKASDAGHVKATESLAGGILRRMFPGVSPAHAVPFLKKAAARGSIKAKSALANVYARGIYAKGIAPEGTSPKDFLSVKPDRKKAEKLLNELVKVGHHKAWITLGDLAAQEKNFHGAAVYYKKATAKGVIAGYRSLVALENGRNNPTAARAWMRAGFDAGDRHLGARLLGHDLTRKNYSGLMATAAHIAKGNNAAGLKQVVLFYGSRQVDNTWLELRKYAGRDMKVGGIGAARRVTEIYIGWKSLTWNTAIIEEQIRTLERIRKLYGSRDAKLAKRIADALPKRHKRLKQARKIQTGVSKRRAQARAYLALINVGHRPVCGAPPLYLRNRARNSEIRTHNRKKEAWYSCIERMRIRLDSERPSFGPQAFVKGPVMYLEEKTPIGTNLAPLKNDDLIKGRNKVWDAMNADVRRMRKSTEEWNRRN